MSRLASVPATHVFVAAFCGGLACALVVPTISGALALLALALALLAVLSSVWRILCLVLALFLAGLWWGGLRLADLDRSRLAVLAGEASRAEVEVTGPARSGLFSVRVPVVVRRWGALHVDEPARLDLPRGRSPPQGARLEVVATVRAPRPAEADGEFDERAYLARQGVHVVLRADEYRVVGRRGGVGGLADRLRHRIARRMAPGLDGERRAVVAGVVLGEDEGLDQPLRDSFRASGLYHLLAVSGQNVAYVVAGALLLAWIVGLPRWAGHAGALVSVVGYVLAVGWQPSVVRAGVAGVLASLAWLAARPSDRWYFLLVGAAVLLAVNPHTLLEPGFQLSFAAVGAIFVAVPRVERRLEGYPLPGRLAGVLAVSAACGVATAPILWLHFGAVPVYSVLANAMAEPVVAPLLGFGLACAAIDHLAPSAALALAWVNGWLAAYLAWCARTVGSLPGAQVESGAALAVLTATVAVAAVLFRMPRRARRRAAVAAVLCGLIGSAAVAAWPSAALPPPEGLRMTTLDVGQGDAILVQGPQGAVLVDQGPPGARVAETLEDLGVEHLAAIVLTHPHRDHVGGAADVLDDMAVEALVSPLQPTRSSDERAALAEAREEGVRVVPARVGTVVRLGRLRLEVLWPDGPGPPGDEDPHAHGVVLLVRYGSFEALLTGDSESDVVLPLRPPEVEVLKVAHHGSDDPGLGHLLALVRPRVAVISVGDENRYGHPTPATLAALRAVPGLRIRRTDLAGDVVIESDGRTFSLASG